ncbi:MAG: DM13 domain-containing protein [Burkholderiaceae bacterium]
MKRWLLVITHLGALALGFALGVYFLPILIAPPAPSEQALARLASESSFEGQFRRDLAGSDALHWGEGKVSVGRKAISLVGKLAPGPDYKLYLSPRFVETEADFIRHKAEMVRVGDVRTFENFAVDVPAGVDIEKFDTVIVWCEAFGEFISAAKYR